MNAALLLVFVHYHWDSSLHEDILFCRELPTRATAQECFRCMDNYFTENGLDWQYCVRVSSDGAASMTGRHHGVIRQTLDRAPEAKWTHRFLHCESLQLKRCHQIIKVDHVQLLYHSRVRWLSRGLVLKRLFELKNKVFSFLTGKKSPFENYYANTEFTAKLASLCDIFSLLNQLNTSLHRRNSNIFFVAYKVQAFLQMMLLCPHIWNPNF